MTRLLSDVSAVNLYSKPYILAWADDLLVHVQLSNTHMLHSLSVFVRGVMWDLVLSKDI